jgi:hypothetical protein
MNRKPLSILLAAALAGMALVGPAPAATPATSDGLVAVQSRGFDEFYLRPDVKLSSYRKVIVDPGQVALTRNWLKQINGQRDVNRWLVPEDAQRITDNVAASLQPVFAEVFTAQGYEIAGTPGSGVLRLTPSVTDLYVNAPDNYPSNVQRNFVRNTGDATLRLDVRDAATGALLGRIVDRRTSYEVRQTNEATNVSNLFWFDALFRQFAANCAKALETDQVRN